MNAEPPQFTRVPFPVKALKLLLHELQTNGEVASMAAPTAPLDTASDDGDSDWSDEEKVKDDRYAFLADVMGVGGGLPFDEDDVLANNDDEDLQKDPVTQIDLRVSGLAPCSNGKCGSDWLELFCRLMSRCLFVRALRKTGKDLGRLLGN